MSGPFLDLFFLFDWNKGSHPRPITAQCETLQIQWDGAGGNGARHYPPYSFSIYTSVHDTPILLSAGSETKANLTIPLAPGSMYEICMYDSRGNTGGCQDLYTVYQSSPSSPPTCDGWSTPEPLKVDTARGKYGWVDQCDTIKLNFVDGQAPYQFSVQPALYPPLNISGITGNSYEWRNILGRTTSFFITVVDANGRMWTQGPMHSGKGKTFCLDYDNPKKVTFSSVAQLAGAEVGVSIAEWILFGLAYLLVRGLSRNRPNKRRPRSPSRQTASTLANSNQLNRTGSHVASWDAGAAHLPGSYEVTPFLPPSATGDHTREHTRESMVRMPSAISSVNTMPAWLHDGAPESNWPPAPHHHDGRSPTSIYTEAPPQIIELPPEYGASRTPPTENVSRVPTSRPTGRRNLPKPP